MQEFQFGASGSYQVYFSIEAENKEAALDLARYYLDLPTIQPHRTVELNESNIVFETVEFVHIENESKFEDVTDEMLKPSLKYAVDSSNEWAEIAGPSIDKATDFLSGIFGRKAKREVDPELKDF